MKICNTCNIEKNETAFTWKGGRSKQRSAKCSACKSKVKRANNPTHERGKNLKRKYGLSLLDYNNLLTDQNGLCKICGNPETNKFKNGKIKPLCVDHCHDNQTVRGLLCSNCNTGLGLFRDNSGLLGRAILYLKQTKSDKN